MDTAISPYEPSDEEAVVGVWHRAGLAEYTYLPTWQGLDLPTARQVFSQWIAPECDLYVARDGPVIVAYLAMKGACIDRLYVDPTHQGRGWGARLLRYAKHLSPAGITLYTHVANERARAFYEAHGFVAVRFGTSPPPESAPDVEYHWQS